MAATLSGCAGCLQGQGPATSTSQDLEPFASLQLDCQAKTTLHTSSSHDKLDLLADSSLVDNLDINQNGDELTIAQDQCVEPGRPYELALHASQLQELRLSGATVARAPEVLRGEQLLIVLEDGAELWLEVRAIELTIVLEHDSKLHLTGTFENCELTMQDQSQLDASPARAQNLLVEMSGTTRASIGVAASIEGVLSEEASLECHGQPSQISTQTQDMATLKFAAAGQ